MPRAVLSASILLVVLSFVRFAAAQPTDDESAAGVYFNSFSGTFFGTEWLEIVPIDVDAGRFRIADIFGAGFDATIAADGTVTLDGDAGTGSLSPDGELELTPTINGVVFSFRANRAPSTTSAFPLDPAAETVAGDAALDGSFRGTIRTLNPQTGQVRTTRTDLLILTVLDDTLRITTEDGTFYQGVFLDDGRVAFRSISPTPGDARFRSLPGSLTSLRQNMLGEITFDGPDAFSGVILLQTIQPLGAQEQTLLAFEATRIPLDDGVLPPLDPVRCAAALCGVNGTALMLLTAGGLLAVRGRAARRSGP